jgi:DNA-binding response OmpR family regulator
MTKPYSLSVLGAHVQALLRRNDMFSEGVVNIPPLRLDLLAGLATLEKKSIPLTQKEMQILTCLAINIGHKVSRDELLKRITPEHDKNHPLNLATHISNIRKKLMPNSDSVFEITGTKDGAYALSRVRYN